MTTRPQPVSRPLRRRARRNTNWTKIALWITASIITLLFLARVVFPLYIAYSVTGEEQGLTKAYATAQTEAKKCINSTLAKITADNKDKKSNDVRAAVVDTVN